MLFNCMMFGCLFLYSFYWSDIQQTLSGKTLFILFTAIIGLNLPIFASYTIRPVIRHSEGKEYFVTRKRQNFFCILAISVFFIETIYSGGVPLIWKLTGDARTYFDFGIPTINGIFYGLCILLGAYSLFKRGFHKYIYLGIGILIISRQMIISILIEGALFYFLFTKKRIKHLFVYFIIAACIGIVGFSAIGNLRTGGDNFLAVAQFKEEYEGVPTALKWLYSYLCFSFSNFNNLVSMTVGGVNGGASTFNELLPTVFSEVLGIKEAFSKNYLVCSNFTVSTFLPSLYLDFGTVGIFIFCFFIGWLSARVYYRVRHYKNELNCMVYSIIGHNLLMMFFSNMFFYLPILGQFLFMPFLFKRRRETLKTNPQPQEGAL